MSRSKGTPVSDLQKSGMSPRATAALQKAGLKTAEAAAAKTDEELLAIKYFAGESLGHLRQWQRALVPEVRRTVLGEEEPVNAATFANWLGNQPPAGGGLQGVPMALAPTWEEHIGRSPRKEPLEARERALAEKILLEMARSRQYSGKLMAGVAWEAAREFHRLEREEVGHDGRGSGSAGEEPGDGAGDGGGTELGPQAPE